MKSIVLNNFNHFQQTTVDVYPCPATATNLSHTKTNIPSKTFHSVVTELKKICVQRSQELNNSLYSNGSAAPTENVDYISQKLTGQAGTSPETKDILNSTSSSSSSDSCASSSASSGSDSSSDSDSTPESDSDSSDSSSSESDSNSKEISCDREVKKISTPTSANAINDTNSPKLRKPMVFLPLAAYKSLTSSIRSVQTPKYRIFPEENGLQTKLKQKYKESTKLQETFLHASAKTSSNLKSRSGFHPDENTHYSRHSVGPSWKEIQNQKNGTKARTQHRFSTPNQADWNTYASDSMRNAHTDSQSSSAGQENRYSQKFGRELFQLKLKLIRINQKEWRVCPAGGSNIVGTTRHSDTGDRDSQTISENNRSLFGTSNKFASNLRHSFDSQDTFEQIYKKRRI